LGFLNTSFLQPAKTASRESPKQMYAPPLHKRNYALKARPGKERAKKSAYINDNIAITPREQQEKQLTSNEESFQDESEITKLTSNTNTLSLFETNTAIASPATDFKAKEDTQTGTTADIVSKKKKKPNLPVYARTSRHHKLVKRTPVYAAVKPQPAAAAANHYHHDEKKEIGVEEFVNQSSARGGIFLLSSMIFLTAFVFASGSREVHRLWMEASVQLRQQQQEQSPS